jgi:hydrogenase expression/formation protein HypC
MSRATDGSEPTVERPHGALPVLPRQTTPGITAADVAVTADAACSVDDEGCITCGDVALPLTVVEVRGADAVCRDEAGREELVATDFVGAVGPGDLLLVHAGVALEQLDPTLQHE